MPFKLAGGCGSCHVCDVFHQTLRILPRILDFHRTNVRPRYHFHFIFNYVNISFSGSLPQSLRPHAHSRNRGYCSTVQRSDAPE